ncbi:YibE/F family protein [Nocardioides sp. ChNu-99]|uniref:YibE/F family protein n=1 Tax=Nocardioides sp. ChNu-99 TaxID=2839897 RepID=UPI002405FB10|nr:YibE/F family protein [Nocardioides sp. ChNu-99]
MSRRRGGDRVRVREVPHGHGHGHVDAPTSRIARVVLLGFLAVVALGSVAGLVALWPSGDSAVEDVQYAAEGVTFPDAEVLAVREACPVIAVGPGLETPEGAEEFPEGCNEIDVRLTSGPEEGDEATVQTEPSVVRSGLRAGDDVVLLRIPPADEAAPVVYGFSHTHREAPLLGMTVLFVVVVAVVARLRGLLALLGLVFAAAVMWWFVIPGLLAGESGVAVAVVGSTVIMFVVLYLAHGPSIRTSTALAGTFLGIAVTALLGMWAVDAARLSGMSGEGSEMLQLYADGLDYKALLSAGIVIAGLGVLNDVTITQSSAVWELRAAAPDLTRRELFSRGMRIGRDHIASTIYTIVFAYAGTALGVLLLLSLYDRQASHVLSDDMLSEEVVRTLASAIGLVASVPITTAVAALTVSGARARSAVPEHEDARA